MTLNQIKAAVDSGRQVCWANEGYRVRKDRHGWYYIIFLANQCAWGLTSLSGRLNDRPEEFFVLEHQV